MPKSFEVNGKDIYVGRYYCGKCQSFLDMYIKRGEDIECSFCGARVVVDEDKLLGIMKRFTQFPNPDITDILVDKIRMLDEFGKSALEITDNLVKDVVFLIIEHTFYNLCL